MAAKKTMVCVFAVISAGLPSSVSLSGIGTPECRGRGERAIAGPPCRRRHQPSGSTGKRRGGNSPGGAADALRGSTRRMGVDRFAAAGLDAPSVTVAFSPGPENCGGFQGRYYSATETVSVCDGRHVSDLVLRTTLLHEMSHAWTQHHLGAANRARSSSCETRRLGTVGTSPGATADRARGSRDGVGIDGRPHDREPSRDTSQRALEESFQLLTGLDPINDGSVPSSEPTDLGAAVAEARLN